MSVNDLSSIRFELICKKHIVKNYLLHIIQENKDELIP